MKVLISAMLAICLLSVSVQAKMARQGLEEPVKSEVMRLFEINDRLHDSFFNYSEQKGQIPAVASELANAMAEVSDQKIAKLLKVSQNKLKEISMNDSRKNNNQRYHLVSMTLIHLLRKYDLGEEYNAYSCPMVKMKWVQNSKKVTMVSNPYAPSMPHCGSQDSDY